MRAYASLYNSSYINGDIMLTKPAARNRAVSSRRDPVLVNSRVRRSDENSTRALERAGGGGGGNETSTVTTKQHAVSSSSREYVFENQLFRFFFSFLFFSFEKKDAPPRAQIEQICPICRCFGFRLKIVDFEMRYRIDLSRRDDSVLLPLAQFYLIKLNACRDKR